MQQATAGLLKESQRKPVVTKSNHGSRTRPTNNQLLYRATFQWEHYQRSLYGNPKLPNATEACASVTSAFLQVVGVLFEVERLREDQPRNILRLLSTNTRRTKVVELSSGTHRVPEELKRHSIGDGEGGQYSTNLDRNRYGSDDQYLATVVRYNLEFLDLCPCLVDVTILDAKGGEVAIVVSAGKAACSCRSLGPRQNQQADIRQRTIRTVGNRIPEAEEEPQLREGGAHRPRTPLSPTTQSGDVGKPTDRRLEAAAPSKSNGGSELFDALLMAATEPQVTSRAKSLQPRALTRSPEGSNEGSEEREETMQKFAGDGPLRRSSRKSVKLFNAAALEREGSRDSDDSMSARSMEDDTDTSPKHAKGFREDWDGIAQTFRGRRSNGPQRGASAANLSKLQHHSQGSEVRKLQQELRRLQEQLQTTTLLLEGSRSQESETQQQLRKLQQEQKAQNLGVKDSVDDQALKMMSDMLAKAGGFQDGRGTGKLPATELYTIVLKEAQDTIATLQKEKAMLCKTLSAAGLPLPLPPSEIPTPQRNGELPQNGFGGMLPPHIGIHGSSAFSVPMSLPAFPAFHSFQRALTSVAPPPLKSPLSSQTPDSPSLGSQTPANVPKAPILMSAQRERHSGPSREQQNSTPAAPSGSVTPAKRRFSDGLGFEQATLGRPLTNGKLQGTAAEKC